jgi:NAD(P)H-quinone oxidoreductase subunit 5
MSIDLNLPSVLAWLGHSTPGLLAGAAVWVPHENRPIAAVWRAATWSTGAAALVALLGAAAAAPHGGTVGAPALVAALVAGLGWVIARFAATYLRGEPRQHYFVRWLLLTLAGATLVCATDQILLLGMAWLVASLALQRLLTFYDQRPQAVAAAHKKFLVSRLADGCVFTAALVFVATTGTQRLSELSALAQAGSLAPGAQIAVLLLAMAAILKCALLPCHGWLMQVMEAPTPVSALLHAGVVNLGGLVLIRSAPLLAVAPLAQLLLVAAGTATAVAAGLVATTRVGVKVALAWSTCAQMGFMVLQCGLGLYDLALLHLLGHSLYKAHAFLTTGDTVRAAAARQMFPASAAPRGATWLQAAALGLCVACAAAWAADLPLAARPELATMVVVLGLALTPLLERPRHWWLGAGAAVLVAGLYVALHARLDRWFDSTPTAVPFALAAAVAAAFLGLAVLQALLRSEPHAPWLLTLRRLCDAGFHLDEWLTRLTWRVWPPRTAHRADPVQPTQPS